MNKSSFQKKDRSEETGERMSRQYVHMNTIERSGQIIQIVFFAAIQQQNQTHSDFIFREELSKQENLLNKYKHTKCLRGQPHQRL